MFGHRNASASPPRRGAAEHPWFRWLAHYGLGLSGAGGFLPEVREVTLLQPAVAVPRRPGPRS